MTAKNTTNSMTGKGNLMALLPSIIQQDITIYCLGNRSGNMYSAKILEVENNKLRVNLPRRIAGNGYLRSSASVVVNFVIGKKLYQSPAEYHAEGNHTRELILDGEIKKTTRRLYTRYPLQVQNNYVPISDLRLARGKFANLIWKRSITLDLSAGGVLFQIPFQAPVNSYLLMNLEIPAFQGPLFVFGQVRWFGLGDVNRKLYLCGARFLLREELQRHFSKRALSELPPIMLPFDKKKQRELDAYLKTHSGNKTQGENDEY
jgi:hypothetical protein